MATVKCHSCGEDNHLSITTELAAEQTMFMEITYSGEFLMAGTVWGTIQNFEKMMVSLGKDIGQKTKVSIKEITQKDGKLRVEYFIESAKNK